MGGDFARIALFQPNDRVVTGDEIHSDLFDEPRVVARVDPVLASGQVAYWKATIMPRSERRRLYRNDRPIVPPMEQPLGRNIPNSDTSPRSSTETDPKAFRPSDWSLGPDRQGP